MRARIQAGGATGALLLFLLLAYTNCARPNSVRLFDASPAQSALSSFMREPAPPLPTVRAAACAGGSFYIDPSAASNGAGTEASPFDSWSAASFAPGACYYQKAGTQANLPAGRVVSVSGSESDVVLIGAYGSGARPVIAGWFAFSGAAYAQIRGLRFVPSTDPGATPAAGVSIVNGSHHIEIVDNEFDGLPIGVWIGSNGGANNLILGNSVVNSGASGIAVDKVNAPAGQATYISNNSVSLSGCHGVDIAGNGYVVERNRAFRNGQGTSGCSGIHTYAGGFPDLATSPRFDGGSRNVIRHNVSYENKDATGTDGNGIQMDQFTSENLIYANFVYGNDGAGISLWDSSSNRLEYNVLVDDGKDPGGTRGPYRSELLIGSDANATEPLSKGNLVRYNLAIANHPGSVAVAVDSLAAAQGQTFAANWFQNAAAATGGKAFRWGSQSGSNSFAWRSASGTGEEDAFTNMPLYQPPSSGYSPLATFGPLALTIDGNGRVLGSWDPAFGLALQ